MTPEDNELQPKESVEKVIHKVTEALMHFIGDVPQSSRESSSTPRAAAEGIARAAALKAATAAGALAIPIGPLGWMTIIPEIASVWKIQSKMVADIAAVFGKSGLICQEQMIYCLFRHSAAHAVSNLVLQVGERYLVRQVSLKTMQSVAKKIGLKVSQRVLSKGITRWVPVVGALGVGGYAWYDTANVAKTAIELFGSEIEHQLLGEGAEK